MAESTNKVKVNLPGSAKDTEVEVLHLGLFPNGKTSTVSDEQVAYWEAMTGENWPKDGTLFAPSEKPGQPVEYPKGTVLEEDTGLPVVAPATSPVDPSVAPEGSDK